MFCFEGFVLRRTEMGKEMGRTEESGDRGTTNMATHNESHVCTNSPT